MEHRPLIAATWGRTLTLMLSFFLLGGYYIIVQVTLIREFLAVLFGNELSVGVILGSWLLGITLGAWLGGKLVDKTSNPLLVYLYLHLLLVVVFPCQVYIVHILRSILKVPPGELVPFFLVGGAMLGIILPFTFLVGILFPYGCRVFTRYQEEGAVKIGWVYLLESSGSLVGGSLFTFYLVTHLTPFQLIPAGGIALLGNALVLYFLCRRSSPRNPFPYLASILLLLWGGTLLPQINDRINNFAIQKRWQSLNSEIELVKSVDSRYENITLGVKEEQYNLFGNGQYISSFPDEYNHANLAHFILTQHPNPQRVLLIGGGIGGLLKEIMKHPVRHLSYVQLDPQLITSVLEYLPAEDKEVLKDPGVRVYYIDGRQFIKTTSQKYDLIILNLPDPSTAMLNRFYTREFFQEAKKRLHPGGILVTKITSAENYLGGEVGSYLGSLYQTLRQVFRYVLVTPGQVNFYFCSESPGSITADTDLLARRYLSRNIQSDHFSQYNFEYLLQPERVEFIETTLRQAKGLLVNTDQQPVTYFFSLILWAQLSEERLAQFLVRLKELNIWWIIAPLVLFALFRTIRHFARRKNLASYRRGNVLFAIASTGFIAMAVEILLLFVFQNIYGYIYQQVGLIVAVFMFGLALGSWGMNSLLLKGSQREVPWRGLLLGLEALIGLFCLSLPWLVSLFMRGYEGKPSSQYSFMLLLLVAGALTGGEFPLAAKLHLTDSSLVGYTAGILDSADHLGACAGALLTGVILVPLLGVKETCLLLVATKVISLAFLGTAYRRA